jgi:hypothetical protein
MARDTSSITFIFASCLFFSRGFRGQSMSEPIGRVTALSKLQQLLGRSAMQEFYAEVPRRSLCAAQPESEQRKDSGK